MLSTRIAWACLLSWVVRVVSIYNSVTPSACHADLSMDEAMVTFIANVNATLFVRNSQCYKCSYVEAASPDRCVKLWSVHTWEFRAKICNSPTDCSTVANEDKILGEKGRYDVTLHWTESDDSYKLAIHETQDPQDPLIPIYIAIAILCALTLTIWWLPFICQQCGIQIAPEPIASSSKRLLSLDTVRGFSLCLMVFVNYGKLCVVCFTSGWIHYLLQEVEDIGVFCFIYVKDSQYVADMT